MTSKLHISFDLDGTLIDSIDLMRQSWEYSAKKLHININFSEYKKYIGLPFRNIIENLNLIEDYQAIKEAYFYFSSKHLEQIELHPEAYKIIQYLEKSNVGWSIITSKPRDTAELILTHFKLQPNYMICPEDTKRGKPFHDPMLLLKDKIHSDDATILYVGDVLSDLQFSVESGVGYIHYTKGIGGRISARVKNKFHQIDELMGIKSIIKKL
tara:strand:- start:136 stop:771 length:636 start_codon:yes stop_codon:yes gene_type:complete